MNDCPLCTKVANIQKLTADEFVWEFPHSLVALGPWQYYEGYCVVVAKSHVTELFDLSAAKRTAFLEEVTQTAQAIHRVVQPRKINYEWLGNQVPHMHWHLFPRQDADPNKLKAVWVEIDAAERDPERKRRLEMCRRGKKTLIRELCDALAGAAGSLSADSLADASG
jgi:diadenosine tetraphosphate (Ap4A) HIT family hydrolase